MKIDLNKTVSMLIILVGHAFFFWKLEHSPSIAFIIIILMFLTWMIWNNTTHSFQAYHLLSLITFSGVLVSVGILWIYGIDQSADRYGTLYRLHPPGVATALGIFFITLLPYVIFNTKFELPLKKLKVKLTPIFVKPQQTHDTPAQEQHIVRDNNWELASEDDLASDNYHID